MSARVSPASVDAFVAGLDYPVFVVTTGPAGQEDPQARSGCLVGFTTQCSMAPARFLICISKANHTYPMALRAPVVAVHVLGSGQIELARLFGEATGDRLDKFLHCQWRPGPAGVPLLSDCPRWMVAQVLDRIDLGDHVGLLVQPTDVKTDPVVVPLMLSDVGDLQAGHPA